MRSFRFGKLQDGRAAGLYILESADGMRASFTDFGATLVSLAVPDRDGVLRDVVLGHDDVSGYENGNGYIGAVVGRFANRVAGARFELGGKTYDLSVNDGANCLHGGADSYKDRLWGVKVGFTSVMANDIMNAFASESIADRDTRKGMKGLHDDQITFVLDDPADSQGFPGDLHAEVTYSLPGNGELRIEYRAVSTEDTPVSLTNHSYFNLNGHDSGSVMDHVVRINAGHYVPVGQDLIPAGDPQPVDGTPFDFRSKKTLGRDIDASDIQLVYGGGYDHDFVLDGGENESGSRCLKRAAAMYSADSGIRMDVMTDMPEMQLYTANGLSDSGKDDVIYGRRSGVCFETQFRPDAVNSIDPAVRESCILKAGEEFRSVTIFRFSNP
ncbi:MAG: galactose mutarotase [Mogibacterium sp.]|nr:galactose mutarotase [Mogibacterium sp.]